MEDAHHERVHIINANPTLEWMVEYWALELQKALDNFCPGVAVSMLKASETARNTVAWRCNCLPWERTESVRDAKNPMRAAPKKDWDHGASVEVDSSTPTGAHEEGEADPDAVPYLVAYRDCLGMYSEVVYSALTGKKLVEYCQATITTVADPCGTVVVLNVTRLPG